MISRTIDFVRAFVLLLLFFFLVICANNSVTHTFTFINPAVAKLSSIEVAPSDENSYGVTIGNKGRIHFVVYAPKAHSVNLLFFEGPDDLRPTITIPMNSDGGDWKIKVSGPKINHGTYYMFQASGENHLYYNNDDDQKLYGLMFNSNYYLNDPYAHLTQNVSYSTFFSSPPFVDTSSPVYAGGGKSIIYDHSNDLDPGHVKINQEDLIIYELHVKDYTDQILSLDKSKRGTYLGLAESGLKTPGGLTAGIDHLVELGVNAVELMPVQEYDEETSNVTGRLNHWGYMTSNFFTPEARYAYRKNEQVIEMKKLVRAFHDKGIAVFMDVVYNHHAEQSPWPLRDENSSSGVRIAAKYYNARGLSNNRFYKSTPDHKFYFNNSGTGNDISFEGGHRYTKRLVTDSLAFWYNEYGIDGFRFDLARILADNSNNAADWIDNDPRFQGAHLHAEPWDLGGAWWDFMDNNWPWKYSNNRWAKWLGQYKDNIRLFSSSSLNNTDKFKKAIEGRAENASTKPWRSINLITAHDGYTLYDCVNSSDHGHKCWNSDEDLDLAKDRAKLMMGIMMTSQGVPLILQGDEFGRTKKLAYDYENCEIYNTYNCESSTADKDIDKVNSIDWSLKDGSFTNNQWGPELFLWTKNLIKLRKKWKHFRKKNFPVYVNRASNGQRNSGSRNDGKYTYIWNGPSNGNSTRLAVVWWGERGSPDVMVIYNESYEGFHITNLRDWSNGNWKVLARSWYSMPDQFCNLDDWENCEPSTEAFHVKGRSMAILISDND